MSRWDLVLDDEPYSAEAMAADVRRREGIRRVRAIGWIWAIHGGLLCGTALLLVGAYVLARAMQRMTSGELGRSLRRTEQEQIDYLLQATGLGLWLSPLMLVVGVVVLVASIAFLRRVRWAWQFLHILSWLHVVGMLPVAWFMFRFFETLEQPEAFGELYYRLANVLDWVLIIAAEILLLWVTVLLRKPQVRELF